MKRTDINRFNTTTQPVTAEHEKAVCAGGAIKSVLRMLGRILIATLQGVSFSLFIFGAFTMAAEWKQIRGAAWKKILYVFTFPLFMLTYIPISLAALVGKVEWKPIRHGLTKAQKEKERA